MARKPKEYPELDAVRDRLGKVPDHVIAAETGTSTSIVGRYRRKLGIPAYDGYKFGSAQRRAPEKKDEDGKAAKAAAVAVAAPAEGTAAPAEAPDNAAKPAEKTGAPAEDAAPSGESADERPRPGGRRSRIEPYRHLVGKVPDAEVAEKAGVGREAVRMYRVRHGIPPYQPEGEAARKAGSRGRKKAAPARRRSKLDPYLDMLGTVPDAEIAALADVTPENVRAYRRRHGIPATWKRGTRGEAARATEAAAKAPPKEAARGQRHAFSVRVAGDGGQTVEYVIIAEDIAAAADAAVRALGGGDAAERINEIRYLAPALQG